MKTLLIIQATLFTMLLIWYGYANSMTANGFLIQGWIGTLLPAFVGLWLFAAGWIIRGMK